MRAIGRARRAIAVNGRLYGLVLEQALKTAEGFEALEAFLRDPAAERAARFGAIWKEAFLRARAVDRALEASMEDSRAEKGCVFGLARAMEDMLFCAKSVVEEMPRLKVGADRFLRDMGRVAREGCADLAAAVRDMDSRPQTAGEAVVRAKKFQSRLAGLSRRAVDNILRHPNAVEVLKTREIYRHFAEAAGRGDAAAEAVGDMLVGRAP